MTGQSFTADDDRFMSECINLAKEAFHNGDVPVGSVVVMNDSIIGKGFNRKESEKDATCHAEILALKSAALNTGDWRLNGCKLYSTAEPCIMCTGAIIHFRIQEVIFGVKEPKFGGVTSVAKLLDIDNLNHSVSYKFGLKSEEISNLMKSFFANIRK